MAYNKPAPQAATPLFRAEVLDDKRERWLGTVLFEPRLSPMLGLLAAFLIIVAIVVFAFVGTYTKKTRVTGWLVPSTGLVRVSSPTSGIITRLDVQQGQTVQQGDPLLVVSADVRSELNGSSAEGTVRSLNERKESLFSERRLQQMLLDEKITALQANIRNLEDQLRAMTSEIDLQNQQIALGRKTLQEQERLLAQNLITSVRLAQAREQQLSRTAYLERLLQSSAQLQGRINDAQATLRQLPIEHTSHVSRIDREISDIDRQIADTETRRGTLLTAPQSGVISLLQASPSSNVQPGVPLVSIVPQYADLQAHFYIPASAVGLLKPGQEVMMRYEAFPYQRYGLYKGDIRSISLSAVNPSEIPPELAVVAQGVSAGDPVYRVIVNLGSQEIITETDRFSLYAGLTVEADVVVDRRPVYRWLFDPVLSRLRKPVA